jgi:hypothetical protein
MQESGVRIQELSLKQARFAEASDEHTSIRT